MSQGKTPSDERERIDAVLAEWPTPERSAVEWDESASLLTKRARLKNVAGPLRSDGVLSDDELLGPSPLTAEPNEGAESKLEATFGAPPPSRDRDRANLRDLAKLAYLTPAPGPASEPPRAPSVPPEEEVAGERKENSGMIHLAALSASAPVEAGASPSTVPAAPVAPASKPAKKISKAEQVAAAPVVAIGKSASGAPRKSGPWVTVFAMTTAAAVTAAVFLGFDRNKAAGPSMESTPAAVASVAPGSPKHPVSGGDFRQPSAGHSPDGVVDPSTLPLAIDSTGSHGAAHSVAPKLPLVSPVPEAPASPPPTVAAAPAPPPPVAAASAVDLQALMQQAAGSTATAVPSAAPAAASPTTEPGSVPLKPSQGAIQGALGAALPAARGCLGEDDAITHATVTFKSDGSVESVSVSGSAAGKPAEGCIRSALMRAKVGPFAQPSFTASVTVRPN